MQIGFSILLNLRGRKPSTLPSIGVLPSRLHMWEGQGTHSTSLQVKSLRAGGQAQWGQERWVPKETLSLTAEKCIRWRAGFPPLKWSHSLQNSWIKPEVTLSTGTTAPISPHPTAYFVCPTSWAKWSLSVSDKFWYGSFFCLGIYIQKLGI